MADLTPVHRNLKDELTLSHTGFLFDHVSGLTYTVNDTAAFILRKLTDGSSAAEIVKALAEEFDVSESVAHKDLESFYEQAHAFGIL
jgi:PqqD family protein of HPr-rel-A system